jgi:anti-sigma factor (TIGR02949 family)
LFSCDDLRSELSNLLDAEISHALRQDIERHLSQCSTCRVILDTTTRTLKIVTDHGSLEVPMEVSERLTARIMASVRKSGSE